MDAVRASKRARGAKMRGGVSAFARACFEAKCAARACFAREMPPWFVWAPWRGEMRCAGEAPPRPVDADAAGAHGVLREGGAPPDGGPPAACAHEDAAGSESEAALHDEPPLASGEAATLIAATGAGEAAKKLKNREKAGLVRGTPCAARHPLLSRRPSPTSSCLLSRSLTSHVHSRAPPTAAFPPSAPSVLCNGLQRRGQGCPARRQGRPDSQREVPRHLQDAPQDGRGHHRPRAPRAPSAHRIAASRASARSSGFQPELHVG